MINIAHQIELDALQDKLTQHIKELAQTQELIQDLKEQNTLLENKLKLMQDSPIIASSFKLSPSQTSPLNNSLKTILDRMLDYIDERWQYSDGFITLSEINRIYGSHCRRHVATIREMIPLIEESKRVRKGFNKKTGGVVFWPIDAMPSRELMKTLGNTSKKKASLNDRNNQILDLELEYRNLTVIHDDNRMSKEHYDLAIADMRIKANKLGTSLEKLKYLKSQIKMEGDSWVE